MFKRFIVFIIIFFCSILIVNAQRGCCSHHGGVAGCSPYGRQVCHDGTLSPSCVCTPPKIYGCTDLSANNYNSTANVDDGSCIYKGCMDVNAKNYNSNANSPDGSCLYEIEVVELNDIPFEIIQEDDCTVSENIIIQTGENGKKEITYLVIENEQGEQISKVKKSEHIILEPTNQFVKVQSYTCDKDEENNPPVIFFALVCLFGFNFLYIKKYPDEKLIINKITNSHKGLYIAYFLFVIPMLIDIILILRIKIKNRID